jgi:trehalose/maltose transport system substrate-binding protein
MKIAYFFGILLILASLGCSGPSRKPVTLVYLDVEWDTPDFMPGLAQDLQDFTRETGIQIRRLPRPEGSLNQLGVWRELLQKGASAPDVVSIDVIWPGILSPYLLDLKPYFSAELSTQNPVVVESYTVDGKLVAIPHHAYVGVLFYRPDLLRKYGYRNPPKTWQQLEAMATRIQSGERAGGKKDFWGYVWQGGIDEDLTCNGLEWQVSEGGGRIIERDNKISVNNPHTIKAWQRAAHWVGSISPPGGVAYEKWDAQDVWSSGNAAFLRSWVGDYGLISRGWPFSGSPPVAVSEIGLTNVPGGTMGQGSHWEEMAWQSQGRRRTRAKRWSWSGFLFEETPSTCATVNVLRPPAILRLLSCPRSLPSTPSLPSHGDAPVVWSRVHLSQRLLTRDISAGCSYAVA